MDYYYDYIDFPKYYLPLKETHRNHYAHLLKNQYYSYIISGKIYNNLLLNRMPVHHVNINMNSPPNHLGS